MEQKKFRAFADSFQATAKLRLESIENLLFHLDNPQKKLKFIHVAGTNGKGSVCEYISKIFSLAGYKTGKYTSPNLITVNERITVGGRQITDCELERIMLKVQAAALITKKQLGDLPTQFEIWTAAAFLYFLEQKCDYVVLETGLGGERDATNIIDPQKCTIITRIADDHAEILGDTIGEIAKAKAGIIKKCEGGALITVDQEAEAEKILEDKCRECKIEKKVISQPRNVRSDGIFECFDYGDIKDIKCGIGGVCQVENACLAAECAMSFGIDPQLIKRGIEISKNPARFELFDSCPPILYDGAHNRNGMQALCRSLKQYYSEKSFSFVMALMREKNLGEIAEVLKNNGFYRNFFTVGIKDNPRCYSSQELADALARHGVRATACPDICTAMNAADNGSDMITVCGSLYLYKDLMREFFNK